MMILLEILTETLSYDSNWAVYAEKIDGMFTAESPARFGQRIFENGGVLDNYEIFATNESIVDSINNYYGDFDPSLFDFDTWAEWILLFESDAGNNGESPIEWGGSKRDVIDYIQENFTDRYDSLRKKWEESNLEFSEEAAIKLINEVNSIEE